MRDENLTNETNHRTGSQAPGGVSECHGCLGPERSPENREQSRQERTHGAVERTIDWGYLRPCAG
jgi:hypothetical protein